MHKKRSALLFLLLLLIFAVSGCGWLSGEEIPRIDHVDDMNDYLRRSIAQGRETIHFTTRELTDEQLKNANESLDGYYGTLNACSLEASLLPAGKKVIFECEVSDQYYVEEYLLHGKEIPEERNQAIELARVCQEILALMKEELGEDSSDYAREKWIHDYIVLHTSYGYGDEEDNERNAHASYGALVSHKAVCNGYAFAMKLLLDLTGIPCKIISGSGDGEPHAWNLVRIRKKWYHVDVTWDDPTPDTEGRVIYTYFNIHDKHARVGHEWDQDQYPKATETTYNYYIKNDLYCKDYEEFRSKCIDILRGNHGKEFQLMVGDYDSGLYSDENLDFIFQYTNSRSFSYQNAGEVPYVTIYIRLE